MARPHVPHCFHCAFLVGVPKSYWVCYRNYRKVSGQDVRTSPKWCPLRVKEPKEAIGQKYA